MALMHRTSLCVGESMGLLAGTAGALLSISQSINQSINLRFLALGLVRGCKGLSDMWGVLKTATQCV